MYSDHNILGKLIVEMREWFEHYLVKHMPGRIGRRLRQVYWLRRFHTSATSLSISIGCTITSPENIYIGANINVEPGCSINAHKSGLIKMGDRVSINRNVLLSAADDGNIDIGRDVLIGPNVVMRASNHQYLQKNIPVNQQGHTGGKIIIGDDVWIGANAVILPDVIIEKGAVIGAGSVVNMDIPAYSLAAGVPARIIKENCRN